MKSILYFLGFVFGYSTVYSQSATGNNNEYELQRIVSSKIFQYNIENSDPNKFGFKIEPADQATGVRNIAVNGGFAYITDPLHGNVKKIDLSSGNIVAVSKQFDSIQSLRNITVFNSLVYAFDYYDKIYIIDLNLEYVKSFRIPDFKREKYIAFQDQSKLTLFRLHEARRDKVGNQYEVARVLLDTSNNVYRDTISLSADEYDKSCYSYPYDRVKGELFKSFDINQEHFLQIGNKKYELREPLPNTFKYYDAVNVDFIENGIVYFSITAEQVTLTINTY